MNSASSHILVVCEKPSMAQSIAAVLNAKHFAGQRIYRVVVLRSFG
jgi:DNA topoisomerase IA